MSDVGRSLFLIYEKDTFEEECHFVKKKNTYGGGVMVKQPLLNTFVNNVSWEETLQEIDDLIQKDSPSYITEINVDVLLKMEKDSYLKRIMEQADMTLVDGQPLIWISKWQKHPIKEKISGSDLAEIICETAGRKGYSVFILGGGAGVAEQAAANMKAKNPEINIVGTYAPPWGFEKNEKELENINRRISAVHPDVLFVCMGCPKQEKWIYENYKKYGAKVSFCSGATVDFMAGRITRAPKWMSDHGLEWFYRFLKEPRRLFKRYFIDDMKILRLIWKYRKR